MGRGRRLLRRAHATSGVFASAALVAAAALGGATAGPARADAAAGSSRADSLASAISPNAASGIAADGLSSVSIAVSADATQDEPATITVKGEAETASRLFVYVSAEGTCESEPASNAPAALSASGGEELAEGSFEHAYEYTPALVGSYTVCAYVDETEAGVPSAIGEAVFEAEPPTASVSVQVSASPAQQVPATITVQGETEVARKLFVYIGAGGLRCEADPAADTQGQSLSLAGGEALSSGAFERTYRYTPPAVGSYTVCAYVDEAEAGVPNAVGEVVFEAARPKGSASIQVSANPIRGEPVTIRVSGETQVARRLFVYISSAGTGCESDPASSSGEPLSAAGGDALAAGVYEESYRYTPEFIATYTICAFVDETEAATPNASAGASFTSSPSQTEIDERAAEAKLEAERDKARRDAEVAASEAEARALGEASAKAAQEAAARAAQEAASRAAREAAERTATQAAAAAAKLAKLKAARAKPVTRLTVSAVAHDGSSLAHPGYTSLDVTTSPYAFVTVTLARNGHRTLRREWGEQASAVAANVSWSCHHPGGSYRYTVTARTDVGRKLTRSGRFAPVSPARCRALRGQETDAGKRQQAQVREREAREYDEEIERRERAQQEERERRESLCRQEGGTPTIVVGSEGATWVCEAPNGATLPTA